MMSIVVLGNLLHIGQLTLSTIFLENSLDFVGKIFLQALQIKILLLLVAFNFQIDCQQLGLVGPQEELLQLLPFRD